MISKVKSFLEAFFEAELDAYNAGNIPDLENYNKKIEEMYSYCHEDLDQFLGIRKQRRLKDPSYYNKWKDSIFEYPRFLFKISQYKNEYLGDFYVAYVSDATPLVDNLARYFEALFIKEFEAEFKIIGAYYVHSEYPDNIHWQRGEMIDANITFENIGDLIAVERYKVPDFNNYEPELSEFCLKEHNADK